MVAAAAQLVLVGLRVRLLAAPGCPASCLLPEPLPILFLQLLPGRSQRLRALRRARWTKGTLWPGRVGPQGALVPFAC